MTSPIRPTDPEARRLARQLIDAARFAALAVLAAPTRPLVTRVGFATAPDGTPLTLISDLSAHTRALRQHPTCSVLIGEPGDTGDPLSHPRLTLDAEATFVPRQTEDDALLRAHWRQIRPKSAIYIGLADFSIVRLTPVAGHLNGGFGKAYELTPDDLTTPPSPDRP